MKLYQYQQDAVDFALANPKCALSLPTAFGKTHTAKGLSNGYEGKTAIITISNELVKQFASTFPEIPVIIGKKHYRKKDYEEALSNAYTAKTVIFNPASFHAFNDREMFDNVIIDEADACLGLFKLQISKAFPYQKSEATFLEVVELLREHVTEDEVNNFIQKQAFKDWRIEEAVGKKERTAPYSLHIYDITFNYRYFKNYKNIALMSGTLFRSDVEELLGPNVAYYDAPSPIPADRRKVIGFCDDGEAYSPDDVEKLAELLKAVLSKHPERPCVVHTTYGKAKEIAEAVDDSIMYYTEKEEKLDSLLAIEGSQSVLMASGAQVGLDLKEDKCRLNILLNGFFPNIGSNYIQKRRALSNGSEWYTEQVLRLVIQACGRSTRGVGDWSKVLICDKRVINLINRNKDKVPKYFIEACQFVETGTEVAT